MYMFDKHVVHSFLLFPISLPQLAITPNDSLSEAHRAIPSLRVSRANPPRESGPSDERTFGSPAGGGNRRNEERYIATQRTANP